MTAKHTSIRETIIHPNPAPSPKNHIPNLTPTRSRKAQTRSWNEGWITSQSSTKIRPHYWHTILSAGRATKKPVRMIFCWSGVSCRRNNGTCLHIFGNLIGGEVAVAAIRAPIRNSNLQQRKNEMFRGLVWPVQAWRSQWQGGRVAEWRSGRVAE